MKGNEGWRHLIRCVVTKFLMNVSSSHISQPPQLSILCNILVFLLTWNTKLKTSKGITYKLLTLYSCQSDIRLILMYILGLHFQFIYRLFQAIGKAALYAIISVF